MGTENGKGETMVRHSMIERAEHWLLAISGFLLIFSGFGELPMYKRFMVTQLPGLGWAGDFFIHLKIHYLSAILFVSVMVFHGIYHGWLGHRGLLPRRGDVKTSIVTILAMFGLGKEPKSHKYLPEQRLAYIYLAGVGLVLVLTGAFKVIKNFPDVYLPPSLVTWMTLIHTFGTIFFFVGVVAHLGALILKVNRPLVKSIFTGQVDMGYLRDRHTLWYDEIMEKKRRRNEAIEMAEASEAADENKEVPLCPAEAEETLLEKEENTMASVLKVKGMSCQHCVMSIKKALQQLEGIENVEVDLQKGEVRYDNTKQLPQQQVEKAIEEAGYQVIQA